MDAVNDACGIGEELLTDGDEDGEDLLGAVSWRPDERQGGVLTESDASDGQSIVIVGLIAATGGAAALGGPAGVDLVDGEPSGGKTAGEASTIAAGTLDRDLDRLGKVGRPGEEGLPARTSVVPSPAGQGLSGLVDGTGNEQTFVWIDTDGKHEQPPLKWSADSRADGSLLCLRTEDRLLLSQARESQQKGDISPRRHEVRGSEGQPTPAAHAPSDTRVTRYQPRPYREMLRALANNRSISQLCASGSRPFRGRSPSAVAMPVDL